MMRHLLSDDALEIFARELRQTLDATERPDVRTALLMRALVAWAERELVAHVRGEL